jgi:hypothetical protein
VAGVMCQSQMMFAASCDYIYFRKRGSTMWRMTWQALCVMPDHLMVQPTAQRARDEYPVLPVPRLFHLVADACLCIACLVRRGRGSSGGDGGGGGVVRVGV